jgi:hypothetical protein
VNPNEEPQPLSLRDIKTSDPFPWKALMDPRYPGRIRIINARGDEVPLLTMTRLLELVTSHQPQPAPVRPDA